MVDFPDATQNSLVLVQSSHLLHALYKDNVLVLVCNILFFPKTCTKNNHLIQF